MANTTSGINTNANGNFWDIKFSDFVSLGKDYLSSLNDTKAAKALGIAQQNASQMQTNTPAVQALKAPTTVSNLAITAVVIMAVAAAGIFAFKKVL
jgi:hypothetical protein